MQTSLHVLLTGATGFLGAPLIEELLRRGHSISTLVRDPEAAREKLPSAAKLYPWDASRGPVPPESLEGVDAVVNLAGEPIADGRWTDAKKKRIHDSRTETTRALVTAMNGKGATMPKVFVSASASGYYGSPGDLEVDEGSRAGDDFLAQVCADWEREAHAARNPRRVIVRISPVLGPRGGMLDKLLPVFRLGAGGPIGNGRHWMSWIALPDLVSLFVFAVENETVAGVLNATSPHPIPNSEFTRVLGEVLHRPAVLRVPAIALRFALGEMADQTVLASQRVVPRRVIETGFSFRFPVLREALENALHPPA